MRVTSRTIAALGDIELSVCMRLLIMLAILIVAARPSLGQALGFTNDFATDGPNVGYVYALAVHDDGTGQQLYAGGDFLSTNHYVQNGIGRWNGSTWSTVGWGFYDGQVNALATFDDGGGAGPSLYAAGNIPWVGSAPSGWLNNQGNIARWDGSQWWPFGNHNQAVNALIVFNDGSGDALYVGSDGYLSYGPGSPIGVGRWNGSSWSSLGGGLGNGAANPSVKAFCVHDDGSGPALFVAGNFTSAGGQVTNGLAKWNGIAWAPVPAPYSDSNALASFDDGSGPCLFTAFGADLYRYQAGSWSVISAFSFPPHVRAMQAFDDGNGAALFAFGTFQLSGMAPELAAPVVRWDGASWAGVGAPYNWQNGCCQNAYAMTTYDFGQGLDLYMGGAFGRVGGQTSLNMARYRRVSGLVAPVCGGDGSLSSCPCNTHGIVGHGCPNSMLADGALMRAIGITTDNSIAFHATLGLPSASSLLFQGSSYNYASSFLGDGVRCAGGNVLRLFVKTAQNGTVVIPDVGDPTLRARINASGDPLSPGSVRYYQLWYRDPNPSFCTPATFNITNGMRVVW